jgi:predicted enzyme related to lactoylglutathione lyase
MRTTDPNMDRASSDAKKRAAPAISLGSAKRHAKAALEKAESLGGKAVAQPYEIPGYGLMAVFQDPEGNRVGLWQR